MKAAIIEFSPSGNTNQVSVLLKDILERNNINTQLISFAGNKEYFLTDNKQRYLQDTIKEHDILFIGSPVYAHHLQYHVKELIEILPQPVNGWSKIAVPFVTYGGISSGISLDEAGKLLRKSGRIVLAGMKISSSHRMTRAFMEDEYNKEQSEDKIISTIQELVNRVKSADLKSVKDNSKHLKYQSLGTYIKSNLIFKEKEWHKKRYPNILIDSNQCIKCGKCTVICPVCHLQQDTKNSIIKNVNSQCIHCFNCIIECPKNAISLLGDLDKAKNFFEKMAKKDKENPDTCLYPK